MTGRIQTCLGFLFVVLLIISGCVSTQKITLQERNKELVQRMTEEVWSKGNLEILDELFSPDFVQYFLPDGSETRVSPSKEIEAAFSLLDGVTDTEGFQ